MMCEGTCGVESHGRYAEVLGQVEGLNELAWGLEFHGLLMQMLYA